MPQRIESLGTSVLLRTLATAEVKWGQVQQVQQVQNVLES